MELSGRVITMFILAGMIWGIFFDVSQGKKKRKKKRAAPPPELTRGQKVAKLIEQYVDGAIDIG